MIVTESCSQRPLPSFSMRMALNESMSAKLFGVKAELRRMVLGQMCLEQLIADLAIMAWLMQRVGVNLRCVEPSAMFGQSLEIGVLKGLWSEREIATCLRARVRL